MREKVYDDDMGEEIDVFDLEVSALVRNCIGQADDLYGIVSLIIVVVKLLSLPANLWCLSLIHI